MQGGGSAQRGPSADRFRFALQIVVAVAVLRAATFVIPVFNQDECYIAIQAHVVDDGGTLYRDVVDRKPPLVPYIYAAVFAAVGSDNLIAVHVLAIFWVAATALVIAAFMRRRAGAAEAQWAAWLFVLGSMSLLPRDALAANFEIWMLLPLCGSMLLAGRGKPLLDALAGVMLGLAVFMKQPALVTLAPLAFAIWRAPRRWLGLPALLGGLVAVFAVMIAISDRAMLEWAFLGTSGYLSPDSLAFAVLMAAIWTGTFLLANAGLCWLATRSAKERGMRIDADLWIWLGVSFIAVAAGLRFLGHYHLQLLPPACLLAARPAAALTGRTRIRLLTAVAVPVVACFGLSFVMPNQPFDTDYRPVSAYISEHTRPGERILIWGHFPEIYWASGRMPATRFLASGFVTGQSGARPIRPDDSHLVSRGAWDDLFADLRRHPPTYVLDLSHGAIRKAQYWPIEHYPALAAWLAREYQLESVVDGVWLYRRGPATRLTVHP